VIIAVARAANWHNRTIGATVQAAMSWEWNRECAVACCGTWKSKCVRTLSHKRRRPIASCAPRVACCLHDQQACCGPIPGGWDFSPFGILSAAQTIVHCSHRCFSISELGFMGSVLGSYSPRHVDDLSEPLKRHNEGKYICNRNDK